MKLTSSDVGRVVTVNGLNDYLGNTFFQIIDIKDDCVVLKLRENIYSINEDMITFR